MATFENTLRDSSIKDVDPVCGMEVEPGRTKSPKRKGWFGRYLDRIAKVNKKEVGEDCPKCH